ncbi:hypothetical protein RvY_17030 [Ramazzottius varieornatus]|uniref:Uncharacterized protein n=1 Tax=Ramazzottius varieornatus TaxID=947166 RepID=A0A1D1W0P9_RAMVA|nr:hypothetical protein RvY_17030 [Ramazzottius varieornatus]
MLAVSTKESGAWLNALPASCVGNLLDDDSLRISVVPRLGAPICEPHTCRCSATVDVYGRHGLSCRYSGGRHSALTESLRRALVTCQSHAIPEPNVVLEDDTRKRPDGMTLVPWKQGTALVWDVTCVDTLCDSHVG